MGAPHLSRNIPRLVGARPGDGTAIIAYTRDGGSTVETEHSFLPWILSSRESLPPGSPAPSSLTELAGPHPLRFHFEFGSWPDLWNCVRSFVEAESSLRGQKVASFAELPHIFLLPDPVDQWLVRSETTYFADIPPEGLTTWTIAVATDDGRPILSGAERPDRAIRVISIAEEGGEITTFRSKKKDERGLLNDFLRLLKEKDPDLIAGIEVQSLLLPYLEKRLSLANLDPVFGRSETLLRPHPITYLRAARDIPGRTVFDLTDILHNSELLALCGQRRMSANAVSDEALVFGSLLRSIEALEPPKRVKPLSRFVYETLTCIVPVLRATPLTPTHAVRASAGTRLETDVISRSLGNGNSLPLAGPAPHTATPPEASYRTGVFSATIEIVVAGTGLAAVSALPATSVAGVSPFLLPTLETIRQDMASRTAPDRHEPVSPITYNTALGIVESLSARQSRFLSESTGKELGRTVRRITEDAEHALSLQNVKVIQHTDDTLLCLVPDNALTSLSNFWAKIHRTLPHGVTAVPLDVYDDCVSLGPRLFALRARGRHIAHRKARIPRFFEPFLREFFSRSLDHCLRRDWAGLRETHIQTLNRIRQHNWHVLDFARQETLAESLPRYDELVRSGKRHPSAAYEAIRSTDPDAKSGTTVRYYITGTKKEVTQSENCKLSDMWDSADPDENTDYYLDRLAQSVERFRILFEPASFGRLFGGEDLFGFDPSAIVTVEHESDPSTETLDSRGTRDGGISLDL